MVQKIFSCIRNKKKRKEKKNYSPAQGFKNIYVLFFIACADVCGGEPLRVRT
jgi:hypothetical protein